MYVFSVVVVVVVVCVLEVCTSPCLSVYLSVAEVVVFSFPAVFALL